MEFIWLLLSAVVGVISGLWSVSHGYTVPWACIIGTLAMFAFWAFGAVIFVE